MSPTEVHRSTPARACAFAVVRRVFERGAYADRAFVAEASGLTGRDRSLAMQIAYGTVQRRATLDYVAQRLVRRPLAQLEPAVLAAIRVGLYQLLYLHGVPAHAAVDQSVELVKRRSPGGAAMVNAVLRRAAREGRDLLEALSADTPSRAAVMHSVPEWLAELWWGELGADQARALLARINEPAESALRVNLLRSTVEEVVAQLPVASRPVAELPEGLVLDGPFDAHGSELWGRGAIMPQSRASMLVARLLAPAPDERVLDLCAAPGAKTTQLAAMIEDHGEVVAVERHPARARALQRTCARMHAGCVSVVVSDARELPADASFDRVLVDPPCSGLGTLQSRPDLRWRSSPEQIRELAAEQYRILTAGAGATRPGGTLLYSVCTISRSEGRRVIDAFTEHNPGWETEDLGARHPQWRGPHEASYLQLLPHRDGTDGFFIAALRRRPGPKRPLTSHR
jgi:16S rRNA (cytosine967-C5)-methyltransferase